MKKESTADTMLAISTGLLAIGLLLDWQWAQIGSLGMGIIGLISVRLSSLIADVWMMLAKLLGYLVPNILLSCVFIFLLTPISMVYRCFSKDPLKVSNRYDSMFLCTRKNIDRQLFKKIW